MNERFGGWFPLLLVAVLAAVTFWLDRVVQPPAEAPAVNTSEPDYIVDGLSAVRMDRQGRVKHTLKAQKMTHYPEADMTVLVEPRLVTYGEGRTPGPTTCQTP